MLFNIEISEGKFLKFNCAIEARALGSRNIVEVYLDNPNGSAFLVDQIGRQHSLVQATGIDAREPVRLASGASNRFTLTFPLVADLKWFEYQANLVSYARSPEGEREAFTDGNVQIRSRQKIYLSDFR